MPRLAWKILAFALALWIPCTGLAADPKLETKRQKQAPTAFAAALPPQPVYGWGVGDGKSYFVPALDIIGFDFLLNQFDRHFLDSRVYGSDFESFKKNISSPWVYDADPFATNQFLHPYQGSMYHAFARSAGLDFGESFLYTALGSVLWELAGETDPPSINDQITTSIGGSYLGESLFRMASLLLESGNGPGFWRELGAFALSPATGFNRYAYGRRFDGVFRSNNPAVYTRFQLGVNLSASADSNVSPVSGDPAIPKSYQSGAAIADLTIAYGLPGKPGYRYQRPFDYFHFQFTATSASIFENVIVRGLLYGKEYTSGENHRGLWGVFGTYDYIAPQIFRVSTAGAALGNASQWWLSRTMALQTTALAGAGYGAAGTLRGASRRDYHNGLAPQGVLDLRLIFGERLALDITARDYYVTSIGSDQGNGGENIFRGDIALTWRVYNLHGITLKYVASLRDAENPGRVDFHQNVGTVSLAYAYLGQTRFGAVDWRPKSAGGP